MASNLVPNYSGGSRRDKKKETFFLDRLFTEKNEKMCTEKFTKSRYWGVSVVKIPIPQSSSWRLLLTKKPADSGYEIERGAAFPLLVLQEEVCNIFNTLPNHSLRRRRNITLVPSATQATKPWMGS